ncbi:unnamed protein product [Durusdinium trenchii]|uniref:BACK domain-containing protein n=1 Tax=Durusdinium trenchii TaxID=1381693 RepID=A0ABP0RF12_9DINO
MPSYQAPTQPSEQLQMPQPQMPQIQQLPPQGGQMLQGQIPQGQLPQGQMPQGQMPMQMVLMPVAMAPMGQGAPCSGYAAPAPAPVPELPVRQPDRGARWPAAAPVPAGPMPQNTVTVRGTRKRRPYRVKSGFFRVFLGCTLKLHWTVDGRKLRGNEKQTVFKMMIYPEMVNEGKGGSYVQIKCEAELEESVAWVSFRISIGSGSKTVGPRGPRYHNFSQSAAMLDTTDETKTARDVETSLAALLGAGCEKKLLPGCEELRWEELPVGLVESILRQDDLPIASEAEVLTLIAKWIGDKRKQEDVTRLLRCFRKGDNVRVRIADIAALMQALGWDIFSDKVPRKGASVWDPNFAIHREGAGTAQSGPESGERKEGNNVEIIHQMGPKDLMQQEPGWAYPGAHRCRVTLTSTSWSHRERRLLRGGPGQAAALQKRAFEYSPSKPAERSPSPPPSLQVRRPPVDTFETFDIAPMSDGSEQSFLGGAVIRNLTQDKIDHELVDHQVICGVSSGYQRHGMRISQCDKKAIYLVEDLNGKHSAQLGGTLTSVTFDLELLIGEASKYGIRRCRLALLRNTHVLTEEWFDVSSKVPLRFYISSSCFDKSSAYTVAVLWLRPTEPAVGRHFYIGS